MNDSRGSRVYSRNSERRKEIGAYEQLFFNGNHPKADQSKLGSLQSVSQGQIMSYQKPVIGANKN
jgi:hypothetical protein